MIREDVLKGAIECVCRGRNNEYGEPEDVFKDIAYYWSMYLEKSITANDVAILMTLLKIARTKRNKDHYDNYIDIAGYAACAGELAFEEETKEARQVPINSNF